VSFEAKRFRHREIAIHQVLVGNIVAAGASKEHAQPQQRDLEDRRTFVCRQVG
jgi:hypothetical protein